MNNIQNRNHIGKITASLLLANLIAVVVGFLLTALFGVVFDGAFAWIVTLVTVIAYLFFIYHEGWARGSSDYNLVKFDRAGEQKWKGEVAGLCAAIPTILLAVLAMLSDAGAIHTVTMMGQDLSVMLYRIWNVPFQFAFGALESFPVLYFLPVPVMIAASSIGYRLGYRQIRLSDYIFYARKKDE